MELRFLPDTIVHRLQACTQMDKCIDKIRECFHIFPNINCTIYAPHTHLYLNIIKEYVNKNWKMQCNLDYSTFTRSIIITQSESSFAGTSEASPIIHTSLFTHARHLIAFINVNTNFIIVSVLFPETFFAFTAIRANCVHTIRITRAHLMKWQDFVVILNI